MDYSVHFSDVRLWSNAALFAAKMRKAQAVVSAITTHGLLHPVDFDILLRSQVSSHLRRFPKDVDTPDVAQLSTLLDESWLGECVIDSRALLIHITVSRRPSVPCFAARLLPFAKRLARGRIRQHQKIFGSKNRLKNPAISRSILNEIP
jgi:hypothetical protein